MTPTETRILQREAELREWFTRDCDPIMRVIDGLDIGWGGTQRWATRFLPAEAAGWHLDVGCGYATFLAQLGWRFPNRRLVGLNIDFDGPHALAPDLLRAAGVLDGVLLVKGDARDLPFLDGAFDSTSCFLGLQDIEIGFGAKGVRAAIAEAVRVTKPDGVLLLVDEYDVATVQGWLDELPVTVSAQEERALDVQWSREVAERAIELYADGWSAQVRSENPDERAKAREAAQARMLEALERQLEERGYYVPFGPMRLVLARKQEQQAGERTTG